MVVGACATAPSSLACWLDSDGTDMGVMGDTTPVSLMTPPPPEVVSLMTPPPPPHHGCSGGGPIRIRQPARVGETCATRYPAPRRAWTARMTTRPCMPTIRAMTE